MRNLFLILIILVLAACGKVVNKENHSEAFTQDLSFVLMEHQCANSAAAPTELFRNISALLQYAIKNTPPSLYSKGLPVLFDALHPMVVSLAALQKEYNMIASNPTIHSMDEILLLYNKAQRFEDLRCSMGTLAGKPTDDLRPYYNLVQYCSVESGPDGCTDSDYLNNKELYKNALSLCEAFYSGTHCAAEFRLAEKKDSLSSLVLQYRQRFSSNKIEELFRLNSDHLKFDCQKEADLSKNITTMIIPIFAVGIDAKVVSDLLAYAEKQWTSDRLKIQFQVLDSATSSTVQIISMTSGISHVPNDNNHFIYLNTSLPSYEMSKVLAHEMGHVLGFPDCYIEYFDNAKKELVYYEIAEKNMNIMCSMKPGVKVPSDYFIQLEQSSCIFR